jgi:hypothetical protein
MVGMSVCAFITLLVLALAVSEGSLPERLGSAMPPLLVLWLISRYWPCQIVLGERGVWQYSILGRRRLLIAWDDLEDPEAGGELGGRERVGSLTNQAVRLKSKTKRLRIMHTPRHDDRERFIKLVRQRIANPPTVLR